MASTMPDFRSLAVGFFACVVTACASSPAPTDRDAASEFVGSKESAARMYRAAEAASAEGHHDDAVRLLRHAIVSLPRTADYDDQRHALVLRMAHLQLLAAHASGDPAHAQDAATMLLAYAQRHEDLFGEAGQAERDDIFELLYEAETFAETLDSPTHSTAPPPPDRAEHRVVAEAIDTHAGEDLEPEISRNVRVRRGWFYDEDDPVVRERLDSWFSGAMGYQFMTTPGVAVLSGPRPMVRRSGQLETVALQDQSTPTRRDVRSAGRSLLRASREGLRECYRAAAARGGEMQTDATVELTITRDGLVDDVVVVAGDVVDGLGDACVIEHLTKTTVGQDAAQLPMRVRVPLMFFYDSGDTMSENAPANGARPYDGPKPIPHPEIHDFAYPIM